MSPPTEVPPRTGHPEPRQWSGEGCPGATSVEVPEQFRRDAVELVRSSPGRPLREIGRELGVNHETLRGWVKAANRAEQNTTGPGEGAGSVLNRLRFNSDRGSEYTSETYQTACQRLGVLQSMGRVGSALDNAAAEAFNSTVKVEYIHRHRFATRTEARLKISTWIVDLSTSATAPQTQRLRRHVTQRLRALHGRSQDGRSRITEPSTIPGD
jgi:transposase-like protein